MPLSLQSSGFPLLSLCFDESLNARVLRGTCFDYLPSPEAKGENSKTSKGACVVVLSSLACVLIVTTGRKRGAWSLVSFLPSLILYGMDVFDWMETDI